MTFTRDDNANSYSSGPIQLTGDAYLCVTLPTKGRIVIRKSNTGRAPWPIVLASPIEQDFQIHLYGKTKYKHIIVEATHNPIKATLYNI